MFIFEIVSKYNIQLVFVYAFGGNTNYIAMMLTYMHMY